MAFASPKIYQSIVANFQTAGDDDMPTSAKEKWLRPHAVTGGGLLAAVLLAGTVASPARAGFVTQSGVQEQYLQNTGVAGTVNSYWNTGGTSSGASAGDSGASVGLGINSGIRLIAYSESLSPDGDAVFVGRDRVTAAAQWLDVLRWSGSGPAPNTLRIGVSVEGSVDLVNEVSGSTTSARIGIVQLTNSGLLSSPIVVSAAGAGASEVWFQFNGIPSSNLSTIGPANAANITNTVQQIGNTVSGMVSWDAYFNLQYNSALGGYQLNLYASAQTESYGTAKAAADFGHTMRLTGVTLADGSALPGAVTFDSGFSPNGPASPTPAPPGLVLAAAGMVTMLGGTWFRRRVRPVAA